MTNGLLRLRADTYYVPVADGVWIRTNDGSFTLRGRTVSTWVERLAPLLDRGVVADELLGALDERQAGYVRDLLGALERHGVLRRESADTDVPAGLAAALPQQTEFLRHFTTDAGAALARVRDCPIAVTGPHDRVTPLAAALLDAGFANVILVDAEPDADLLAMADALTAAGAPVRVRGPGHGIPFRHVLAVFDVDETDAAFALADRADAAGAGAWLGLVRGQTMLLKGQLPGAPEACVRCAWRRLVHPGVDLPATDVLGHVPVAVAGAVLAQDVFQHVSGASTAGRPPAAEGVVVDLTRLSIWRTPVDRDPTCPRCATVTAVAPPDPPGPVTPLDRIVTARCFGPVLSCSPEELPQVPLTAVRVRCNPLGRSGPIGVADGPVVVGDALAAALREGVLFGVERELAAAGRCVVGAGNDEDEALGRAVRAWAARWLHDGWADAPTPDVRLSTVVDQVVPPVRLASHPAGWWRAGVDGGPPIVDTDAERAATGALLHWVATQVQGLGAAVVVARPAPGNGAAVAAALGLTCRPVPVPPLAAGLVAVAVRSGQEDRA